MQGAESPSFHGSSSLFSCLFKAALKCVPIFSRMTFPRNPVRSLPLQLLKERHFSKSIYPEERNISEWVVCTACFEVVIILASKKIIKQKPCQLSDCPLHTYHSHHHFMEQRVQANIVMGQIWAGSDMAEMARLPLLPLLGRPKPSPAWPKPSPGLAQDLRFFEPHFFAEI